MTPKIGDRQTRLSQTVHLIGTGPQTNQQPREDRISDLDKGVRLPFPHRRHGYLHRPPAPHGNPVLPGSARRVYDALKNG